LGGTVLHSEAVSLVGLQFAEYSPSFKVCFLGVEKFGRIGFGF